MTRNGYRKSLSSGTRATAWPPPWTATSSRTSSSTQNYKSVPDAWSYCIFLYIHLTTLFQLHTLQSVKWESDWRIMICEECVRAYFKVLERVWGKQWKPQSEQSVADTKIFQITFVRWLLIQVRVSWPRRALISNVHSDLSLMKQWPFSKQRDIRFPNHAKKLVGAPLTVAPDTKGSLFYVLKYAR
jgi:hypothetical protein